MMEAPRRATVRGPTFIRLLARLTASDLPAPTRSLSDQLSEWIDWPHAVALSTVLDGKPTAALSDERSPGGPDGDECARVRVALAGTIAGDRAFCPLPEPAPPDDDERLEYPFYRQRYQAMQQAMEAGVGRLRERLRDTLTLRAGGMARLAALDALMERALARRERSLLSAAPVLLGGYFERLRQAARERAADAPAPDRDWLDVFRNDMHDVLLAELDVRLQPAQGLLAALRTQSHG